MGGAPQPVWTLWNTKKSVVPAGNQTSIPCSRVVCSLVIVTTTPDFYVNIDFLALLGKSYEYTLKTNH